MLYDVTDKKKWIHIITKQEQSETAYLRQGESGPYPESDIRICIISEI